MPRGKKEPKILIISTKSCLKLKRLHIFNFQDIFNAVENTENARKDDVDIDCREEPQTFEDKEVSYL